MTATGSDDRIDVRGDGRVLLYKREGLKDPKWQVRIRVPNAKGYKIVTTKTANLREAERFALDLYEDLYLHVKAGGSIVSKIFRKVFEEWKVHVGTVGHNRRGGSWDSTIHRVESYALKFFGDFKIEAIGRTEFADFWAWRKANYNKKKPSNATLRRERTSILPVFKYAASKGYITRVPDTDPPKAPSERRPTFLAQEWATIRSKLPAWVEEGRKLATWRDRFMAQHCFMILANTGLRVGELRNLRWSDVVRLPGATGEYFSGHVRGKTGIRTVVFQPGVEASIAQLYRLRCKELAALHPDEDNPKPDRDSLIICHPDGSAIRSMKHSFESLLKFAGVPKERDGRPRTIYSLRHFYATRQLSNEASPYLIAGQMGTSVEMLERHYGQVMNTSVAAQITKAKPANLLKADFELPF